MNALPTPAELRDQLQTTLGSSYLIERELGRGGMATVFLAHDRRHDRPVALKVLHPELAQAMGPERFQREIRLVARLQHPHILTVHDSGDAEGQLWFTMPYVEGRSLRDRLARERQLPVADALRIAREAAMGLEYAHQHGVIHRDIKPENLLLTEDGSTLVADFGIARALGAGAERLTESGVSVGTPAYMSPEQASAESQTDGRTDVYSLGAVLYEMLAGEPPFTGPTAQAVIAKRMSGPAPSVRQVRPAVGDALDDAIRRALAPVPADRYASAAEFARALERVERAEPPAPQSLATPQSRRRRFPTGVAILVLGFLLGVGVLFAWRSQERGGGGADVTTLAVLPFENLGSPDQEYFADGMTDEVRGKLAAIPTLRLTAGSSSGQYKKVTKTVREIGAELGVQYLLTAKVRWEKNGAGVSRVRVSPELISVATASTKWGQPFDAELSDVFQVQADIAGRVAEALDVALGARERRTLAAPPTENLSAYDEYLRAEEILSSGGTTEPSKMNEAIRAYERAVALDPDFAVAWAQLSRARSLAYGNGQITSTNAVQARAAAERALALAPTRFEGRLALGDYYSYVTVENGRALEQYALAQRLGPHNAEILSGEALSEQSLGRWDASVLHLKEALALDPRSARTAARLARTLLWLRRYPEALVASDRAMALAPTNVTALEGKAMVYLAQGDLPRARGVLRSAPREVDATALVAFVSQFWDLYWALTDEQQQLLLRLTPEAFDDNRAGRGLALAATHALRGHVDQAKAYADSARVVLESQIRATPDDAQLHVLLGTSLAYLGRRVDAVREGERAVAMLPLSKDAYVGAYLEHQLARIYILAGEQEKAVDRIEQLLKMPYFLSPRWLKIDPTFAPLRSNARFQRLAAAQS